MSGGRYHQGMCPRCYWFELPSDDYDRRLADGFALIDASEDCEIDPNAHLG